MPSDQETTTRPVGSRLPEVPGYVLTELISGTPDEVTFRGRHAESAASVLVEMYRSRWPSERDLAARRHAYEVGSSMRGSSGVLEHIELVETKTDLALVMADPGTVPLVTWIGRRGSDGLAASVAVSAKIADAVAQVHSAGIVHNSVNPVWIHVDGPASGASLSGFARSSRLRSEAAGAANPGTSIAYISPEQTGRMNRPVDSRSDLYAVGVILFQVLTGRLPFPDADPLALVHAHIARRPPPASELAPEVPPLLDRIVATLLSKNAGDRYATALGLKRDLERAAEILGAGEIPDFEIRSEDVSDQLVLPEGLYGRQRETTILHSAVSGLDAGERRALFVAGYSGIGKSVLVNELQPSIVERSGWFGGGKFDLYRRDIPYFGWVGAMEGLVRQALTLPEKSVEGLRSGLISRIGANRAALTDVAPRLTALVGEAPPLPEVSPAEAQARFDQAFRNLVRGFASSETPLVLFVDDLQWADLSSLRLLEAVLTDREASNLLVLGAWRDNEIGPDHPLRATLRSLTETGVPYDIVELGPLPDDAIDDYLADTVHRPQGDVLDLSRLVREKTGGNPFYMKQFLTGLNRDGALSFRAEALRWGWDLDAARSKEITANVADLMARRVATMEGPVTDVIQLASCIGSEFTLGRLAGLASRPPGEVASSLDIAMEQGLIVPLDDSYRYAAAAAEKGVGLETRYAFTHDKVREAAHDGLDADERARAHLALARQMMSAPDEGDEGSQVVVASHLTEALDLLADPEERLRCAELFLEAGSKAKVTMATSSARAFLDAGLELLPADAWESNYDMALSLHTEAADVAYIEQRFDDVERYAPIVLDRARTALDRVPIHNIMIGIGVSKRAYRQATEYAVDVLADDYGIRLPKDPSTAHVLAGVVKVKTAMRGLSTEDLLNLPPMSDPNLHAVMGILMKTATNAYWATPNLVPLIAFEMCRLSARHGNIGLSAYGYALYGMITSAALGQVDLGQRFGQLSMDLLAKTGDTHLLGKTALLWHGFIRHNKDPLRVCGAAILGAYDVALDAGDVENAVYCGTVGYYTEILAGHSLDWMRDRYSGYVQAMLESGQDQTIGALKAWMQCVDNLSDSADVTADLIGDHVDFGRRLPELLAAERGTAIPVEVSAAGFLAFLLDDMDRAERYLGINWEHREEAPGQSYKSTTFALYAVTLIRKGAARSRADRVRLWRLLRDLARRRRHNSHDLDPFLRFIDAETLRAHGDDSGIQRYLDCADLAKERGFLYLEALALQEAAEMQGAAGHAQIAGQLAESARSAWGRYGAHAKLRQLGALDSSGPEATASALAAIDSRTLLGAVQAVAGEIELDLLVNRVLGLSIQNAGARYGALVLQGERDLETIACASVTDDGDVAVLVGDDTTNPFPKAIVDYAARTHEPLLIDDASTEELFARDPYVVANGTRSVLCTPLIRSGRLVGVLYLDNDMGIGVFTPAHLATLQAIGGQAAVSLENSRLFEHQRAQAEAFARFVPRAFLEQLDRDRITDVALGDAVLADLAVLFSDIRGFTSVSERLAVTDNFALLNDYLAVMEPPIRDNGGFIDKFIGDAVMALFVKGAEGAVRAGVAMHRALRSFNQAHQDEPLRMGVGIHFGSVMLGTVGSPVRMETTVIGDAVNTASRMEGMTKPYSAPMLITEEVVAHLDQPIGHNLREVGRVRVKGKQQAMTVFEVLDARPDAEAGILKETRTGFEAALSAWYEGDFASALDLFSECVSTYPADALAEFYAKGAAIYLEEGVPPNWEGIDTRTEK